MGTRMTVTDRRTLVDIIIDELGKANDKKITPEKLDQEAKDLADNFLGNNLKDHETLKQKIREMDNLVSSLKNKMKSDVDKLLGDDTYWGYGDNFRSYGPLVKHFTDHLRRKYKLTKLPKEYDIEKEIVKAGNQDYDKLIKSVTKLFK